MTRAWGGGVGWEVLSAGGRTDPGPPEDLPDLWAALAGEKEWEPDTGEIDPISDEEVMKACVLPQEVTGFVISVSKRWSFRRLHRFQGCNRVPGVHYHVFEGPFDDIPPVADYDDVCKDCWSGKPKPGGDIEEAVESGSSSTEAEVEA